MLTEFTQPRTANIFSPAFAYPENNLQNVQKRSCKSFSMGYKGGRTTRFKPQTERNHTPMNASTLTLEKIEQMFQDGAISQVERINLVEKWVARQKRAMSAAK